MPMLHSALAKADAKTVVDSRGIFRPCSRPAEGVSVVRAPLELQIFGIEMLNSTATAVVCPHLTFAADFADARVGQYYDLRNVGAAVKVLIDDAPNRLDVGPGADEAMDEENVVEFRSLPRLPEPVAARRTAVRLSAPAVAFVRSKQGHRLRIESNLEEEPE